VEVKIHAKLVIADDHFLRVGSSNLNNRSMSVDTECDLALEARTAAQRAKILAIRNRLVAEQLHRPVAEIVAAVRRSGSLIAAIEALNDQGYLQPLPALVEDGPIMPMPGTAILDPRENVTLERLWSELGPGAAAALFEFAHRE
jgi:phosphatidylserine/phosphatidylglycerophosphate/cardiolipin synthase-like enzyme